MKHVIQILISFLIFLVSFVSDLLGIFVVALALLFCNEKDEYLPKWAWLWDNKNDSINGDGNSTSGWRGPEHANGQERTYWWRYKWLALRNPSNNLCYLLGFTQTSDLTYKIVGDIDISDQPKGKSGNLYIEALRNSKQRSFCYYYIKQYGKLSYCLRIYIGWKIKNIKAKEGNKAQFVFTINPVNKYKI